MKVIVSTMTHLIEINLLSFGVMFVVYISITKFF